jgi:hypothetical protein
MSYLKQDLRDSPLCGSLLVVIKNFFSVILEINGFIYVTVNTDMYSDVAALKLPNLNNNHIIHK